MFTIILEDNKGKMVDHTYFEDSDKLFFGNPNLKLLNHLSSVDYDVFNSSNVDAIIQDLTKIKADLEDKEGIEYIEKALLMARQCKKSAGSSLSFTPFGL